MHKCIFIIFVTICFIFRFIKTQIEIQLNNKYQIEITLSINNNASFHASLSMETYESKFPSPSNKEIHFLPETNFIHKYIEQSTLIKDIHHNIYSFPLYYSTDYTSTIGLNPTLHNESFILALYNKGLISNKVFALELKSNDGNNYLYLGKIPSYKVNQYQRITVPRIEDTKTSNGEEYWGFRIKALSLNGSTIKIDSTIFIAIAHESLILNERIYKWIRDTILYEYISNGTCVESEGNWVNIKCNSDIIRMLPKLQFVISEKPLQVFEVDFINESDKLISFTYNKQLDKRSYIFINRNLFYGKIIQFDYDLNEISFYINKKCAIYDEIVLMKKTLFINVILLVLGGSYLIYSFISEKTIIIL